VSPLGSNRAFARRVNLNITQRKYRRLGGKLFSKRGILKTDTAGQGHKTVLDSLLLPIRGVEGGEMSGLPAYFVNKRMFACIHGEGVGYGLPAATAANLQFSNQNVFPFQPKGMPSTPGMGAAQPREFHRLHERHGHIHCFYRVRESREKIGRKANGTLINRGYFLLPPSSLS